MGKLTQEDRKYIAERIRQSTEATMSPYLLHRRYKPQPKRENNFIRRAKKRDSLLAKRQEKRRLRRLKRKGLIPKQNKGQKTTKKPKQYTYAEYIQSKAWRQRCDDFYGKYGRKCFACYSTKNLHVHHMAYTHMGNELDTELSVLCKICHAEFHLENGTQRDMIAKTIYFIERKLASTQ